MRVLAFDLGGERGARSLWQDYHTVTDAVVFVVDAGDRERLEEASSELWSMVATRSKEPGHNECVLLVLGNKVDRSEAASGEEIRRVLRLGELGTEHFRAVEEFQVSLYTGAGYVEAFKWLEDHL